MINFLIWEREKNVFEFKHAIKLKTLHKLIDTYKLNIQYTYENKASS